MKKIYKLIQEIKELNKTISSSHEDYEKKLNPDDEVFNLPVLTKKTMDILRKYYPNQDEIYIDMHNEMLEIDLTDYDTSTSFKIFASGEIRKIIINPEILITYILKNKIISKEEARKRISDFLIVQKIYGGTDA